MTTCYAYRVEAGPYFVSGLPQAMLIELRQALIAYQDYHMLLLTRAQVSPGDERGPARGHHRRVPEAEGGPAPGRGALRLKCIQRNCYFITPNNQSIYYQSRFGRATDAERRAGCEDKDS